MVVLLLAFLLVPTTAARAQTAPVPAQSPAPPPAPAGAAQPMVTKAYLETHPNATTAVPQPARWNNPGRYPTTYTVAYDAPSKEYRFVLGGLTKRP